MITENGQQGKAEIFYYIEVCCQRVSETYGKPDRDKWINSDYVSLSHILFKKTHVRISPNTLKRIFGKIKTDVRYYPQKATRDALAIYLGHPDWEHFVQVQEWAERHPEQKSEEPIREPLPVILEHHPPTVAPTRKWPLPVLTGVVLLAILGFFFFRSTVETAEPAKLTCLNPLGENPHSAVFKLQRPTLTNDESDQYMIQFGDGKKEIINSTDSLYTHYYERPGRYFAILQRNGQSVDTATVYLQTKGWTVTANMMHDTTRVYPIEVRNLFVNGQRSVSTLEAAHAGVDTNRTFFMEFINSHPTTINGDNFELTTHVQTSPDRAGVRCSQVGLTVWGESSQHLFDVMKPGCVHWIDLQTSDIHKNGHRDDLSFMGADFRAGGMLKLQVVNKRARIFIDGRQVYEATYTKPLHQVYGVKVEFSGIGTVNSFLLKDLKTGQVFDGSF
ncbi:hypothetical protein GO755_34405 [Spirosoma sp. HMF4905]|uniref:PKD domain-containing protein n=1 Tax=Spirosoma arboris TaxID=2682092 RepID=A0A7K1SN28_9BACT|nr:hypothetical protein [Spirosoma arboris]MVM35167.1 hypothetical protein [Spirosoma arboris]